MICKYGSKYPKASFSASIRGAKARGDKAFTCLIDASVESRYVVTMLECTGITSKANKED